MWLLLAALCTAQAKDTDDHAARWAKVEVRARRSYHLGWWAGFLGTSTKLGGTVLNHPHVQLGGAITQKSGVGLMLASGLRERRAILGMGGDIGAARGRLGLLMWGLSGVLDIGGPRIAEELAPLGSQAQLDLGLEIGGMAATLASYVLAVSQHRHNLLVSAEVSQASAIDWQWQPVVTDSMAGGRVLGRF